MNRKMMIMMCFAALPLTVGAQRISIRDNVIDCGQVLYRNPMTVTYELENKDNDALKIDHVEKSCGCTDVFFPKNEIPGHAKFAISAIYDAKQMGHFEKRIYVYSNGSKEPVELTLKGEVVAEIKHFKGEYPYTLGTLNVDKDDIEFDDVNSGDMPVQQINIMNTSAKTVKPVVMHLPPYLKAEVSPSTIAPGHSGVARITLNSRKLRDYGLTQTSVYLGAFPGDKVNAEKEISVSAVLLPGFNNMTPELKKMAPKLEISTKELTFSTSEGKKREKVTIEIANKGRSRLDIRSLQLFTSGLNVSLNRSHIEPGHTAKLKITADMKQIAKARRVPRVLMITNDPDNPKVVIRINVK